MKMDMTRKRMIYTVVVTLIIVFSTTYAILMTLERMDYRNYLQGQYSKNLYELINNLENIEENLAKSAITSTREQNILIFEDIFRYSSAANDQLSSLPIPVELSQNTNKFLSQVGDYCYTLVKANSDGKELSDTDYKTIKTLENQSYNLKQQLNNVLMDINEGRVSWGEIRKKVTGVIAMEGSHEISEKFKTIQKQVTQYPSLIYDGPFSDNILEIKPKVNSEKQVSQQQAEEVVRRVVGNNKINKIQLRQGEGLTRIASYSFNVTLNGKNKDENIVCEVSKHGGKIVYLLNSKRYSQPKIDEEKAIQMGTKFLSGIGYKEMSPTYSQKYEDNIVVNYVHMVDNAAVYTEQIKLKIALDDGTIVGIEAEKYLVSYDPNRKVPKAKVTLEEAKKMVNSRLSVKSTKLAIIPTETNNEILCYEFSGVYGDDEFVVYVNAENGKAERILKIINTPYGRLTM